MHLINQQKIENLEYYYKNLEFSKSEISDLFLPVLTIAGNQYFPTINSQMNNIENLGFIKKVKSELGMKDSTEFVLFSNSFGVFSEYLSYGVKLDLQNNIDYIKMTKEIGNQELWTTMGNTEGIVVTVLHNNEGRYQFEGSLLTSPVIEGLRKNHTQQTMKGFYSELPISPDKLKQQIQKRDLGNNELIGQYMTIPKDGQLDFKTLYKNLAAEYKRELFKE